MSEIDLNKIGETTMEEIRGILAKIYPKLREYLQKNHPYLVAIYDYYYERAMSERWQIAIEYAYRILRIYLEI